MNVVQLHPAPNARYGELEADVVRYGGPGHADPTEIELVNLGEPSPRWFLEAVADGRCRRSADHDGLLVHTPAGTVAAPPGWWIVRNALGELSIESPYCFDQAYRQVTR